MNLSFVFEFSSFISEIVEGVYINNFISNKIFSSSDELIEWVQGIVLFLDLLWLFLTHQLMNWKKDVCVVKL